MSRAAQPGDGGPCPICGLDMREKVYTEDLPGRTVACSGRYWHMKHEHGTLEDYYPPPPPADSLDVPPSGKQPRTE